MQQKFEIRPAKADDLPLILTFIKELAQYEKMADQVVATEELLQEWLFQKRIAEAIIGEVGKEPVAFALYFHNFSTFLGKGGLYLEDIYVRPQFRKRGYGKALFKHLAKIAVERGCGRFEWFCLNWNRPSIDFYLSLQARPLSEWTVFRLEGESLARLAEQ